MKGMKSIVLSAALALLAPGCVGYTTYPPGAGRDAAFNSPNVPPGPEVIYQAVAYATSRYPVTGAYAVNLPPELDPKRVEYIFDLLDDPDAGVLSPEAEAARTPVYHVGRVWIRGVHAEVDVFRPVLDIPGPAGAEVTQMVTLTLRSNFASRWRVTGSRSSAIGLHEAPDRSLRDPVTAAAITTPATRVSETPD